MDAEGVLPVGLAGARVERGYGPGMPDDELGPAADLDQQRGVVAGLPVRGKGAPALLAGDLVKSHDLGIGLASDQGDEQVAVDQGRAGDAPGGDFGVVVGDVVLAPEELAGGGADTGERTGGAEHIDAVAVDGGRGAGAIVVGHAAVVGRPFERPEKFARGFVEGERALGSAAALAVDDVGDEDPSAGDRGGGIAGADRGAPGEFEARGGEALEDAGFGPLATATLAAPFGPVLGVEARQGEERQGKSSQEGDDGMGMDSGWRMDLVGQGERPPGRRLARP